MSGVKAFKMGVKPKIKKSKLQLHREAEARKRQAQEEEAAAVLKEFEESFGASEEPGTKEFVKAGVAKDGHFTASGGQERYKPGGAAAPAAAAPPTKNVFDAAAAAEEQVAPKLPTKRKKEPSARELFLAELKADQAARDARDAARKAGRAPPQDGGVRPSGFDKVDDPYSGVKGSFADPGDSSTTNLYIGNLHPAVNEDLLARTFSVHGAIASIKIMWPRTDEERERQRNSGFVQFMERRGAERAKNALDGTTLNERQITISFGKPCARPAVAMYPATMQTADGFSGVDGWSMTQHGAMVPGAAATATAAPPTPYHIPPGAPNIKIVVRVPTDAAVMSAADKVAEFVKDDGWALEQLILEREMSNPMFTFLHDTASPDHTYYRWRAYSLAQGDKLNDFRTEPFQMYQNGPVWQPPACPITLHAVIDEGSRPFSEGDAAAAKADASGDSAAASAAGSGGRGQGRARSPERRGKHGRGRILNSQLSARQLEELHAVLRGLTVERKTIEEGMMWCLDHSDAAAEVVDALHESLTLAPNESTVEKKMARLYLVSDILHNSSAPFPKTGQFRSRLEGKLPAIMDSLRQVNHLACCGCCAL